MWKSMKLVRVVCNEIQLTEQRFRHIVDQTPHQIIHIDSLVDYGNLKVAEDPFLEKKDLSEYLPVPVEARKSKITSVFYNTDHMVFCIHNKEDDNKNEPGHEKVPIVRPGPEAPAPALDQPPDPFPEKVVPKKIDKGHNFKNEYSSTAHAEISCGGYCIAGTRNGLIYV